MVLEESKEKYVARMLSFVDIDKAKETWSDFYKSNAAKIRQECKRNINFWIDFMELDDADLTDLDILSEDVNFYKFVLGGDDGSSMRILNDEVFDKVHKKTHGDIPDHIQYEIEGDTASGKSTCMLAINYTNFNNYDANLIFYMKQDLLNFIKEHKEIVKDNMVTLDEDVKSHGIGSQRTEEDLGQIIESCRKAKVSFSRCRAVAKHENQTVYYRFFVFCKNVKRRISCASVYRKDRCIGFIVIRIPYTEDFFRLEYDYNARKDIFIENTLSQENKDQINIEKCAKDVITDLNKLNLPKISKKEIKLYTYKRFNHLTTMEQDLIVTEAYIILQTGNI